jgi:hypothetical protein
VTAQAQYQVGTFPRSDPPGFGDGFEAGFAILRGLWIGLRFLLGFLVPLLVLVPFVVAGIWALRRWRSRRPATTTQPNQPAPQPSVQPSGAVPPPPAPADRPTADPPPTVEK